MHLLVTQQFIWPANKHFLLSFIALHIHTSIQGTATRFHKGEIRTVRQLIKYTVLYIFPQINPAMGFAFSFINLLVCAIVDLMCMICLSIQNDYLNNMWLCTCVWCVCVCLVEIVVIRCVSISLRPSLTYHEENGVGSKKRLRSLVLELFALTSKYVKRE